MSIYLSIYTIRFQLGDYFIHVNIINYISEYCWAFPATYNQPSPGELTTPSPMVHNVMFQYELTHAENKSHCFNNHEFSWIAQTDALVIFNPNPVSCGTINVDVYFKKTLQICSASSGNSI